MTSTLEVIDPCTICHKPKADHNYRHAWVGYGDPQQTLFKSTENDAPASSIDEARPSSQGSVRIAPGGDPILRMALLRKGVITLADLDAIDAELKGAGVAYHDSDSVVKP